MCEASIDTALIESNLDSLVHLDASVMSGHAGAVTTLARFGSAARGDPIYEAGVQLGKLLRTAFLADDFVNAAFRRGLRRVLNRGEAVNALKRAIYTGRVALAQARRADEMQAAANALSLLANIVMAWNTAQMQAVLDRLGSSAPDRAARADRAHRTDTAGGHQPASGLSLPRRALRLAAPAVTNGGRNKRQQLKSTTQRRPSAAAQETNRNSRRDKRLRAPSERTLCQSLLSGQDRTVTHCTEIKGTSMRTQIDDELKRRGLRLGASPTVANLNTLIGMLDAGMGVP